MFLFLVHCVISPTWSPTHLRAKAVIKLAVCAALLLPASVWFWHIDSRAPLVLLGRLLVAELSGDVVGFAALLAPPEPRRVR